MLRLETSVKISDTAQNVKFSSNHFLSECEQIASFADFFIFTKEILKEKLPLFCIVRHDRIHHGLLEQNFLL